jgi:hypothetical protein
MTRITVAAIVASPRVKHVRCAPMVALAVVKRFMRSGSRFPVSMPCIPTAQVVFASAPIDGSDATVDRGDGAKEFMRSGNALPKDMKRSCHDPTGRREGAKEFMRTGKPFPESLNRLGPDAIVSCLGRAKFVGVTTSIMRSGNEFPEPMPRLARDALRVSHGEVERCRVLSALRRGSTSFAHGVRCL